MQLPDFIIIPGILIQDKSLQPLDREVYGIIYWASKMKNEKCTMSNQTIADLLDAVPTSISHSLKRLWQGRYIFIKADPKTRQRLEILPLVTLNNTPSSNEQAPSSNEQGGIAQMNNRIILDNINNTTTTPISPSTSLVSPSPSPIKEEIEQKNSSKHAIMPLTALEKWEMAKSLDVPLWVVEEVDKQFWDYVELPKNRKKYKTSYKTIKRWVEMGLSKNKYNHCNEVETMELDNNHPDKVAERAYYFGLMRQRGELD